MNRIAILALAATLSTPVPAADLDAVLKSVFHGDGPPVAWVYSDEKHGPHPRVRHVTAYASVEVVCDDEGRCRVIASGHS